MGTPENVVTSMHRQKWKSSEESVRPEKVPPRHTCPPRGLRQQSGIVQVAVVDRPGGGRSTIEKST
jgi:hypothetical protein